MPQDIEPRKKPMQIQLLDDKWLRIYNGERTTSSVNGDGENGQPPAKE